VLARDAGGVDENVDAPQRRLDLGGGLDEPRRIGDVDDDARRGRAELGPGLVELAGVDVPQAHLRPRGDEAPRDGKSDALRASGDDGDLSGKIYGVQSNLSQQVIT